MLASNRFDMDIDDIQSANDSKSDHLCPLENQNITVGLELNKNWENQDKISKKRGNISRNNDKIVKMKANYALKSTN